MLREQIAIKYCEALDLDYWTPMGKREGTKFASQILNFFKAKVDKLTVIDDEIEEFVDYEVEYAKEHELHFPLVGEHRDICNREAQLQDTKKHLLEGLEVGT